MSSKTKGLVAAAGASLLLGYMAFKAFTGTSKPAQPASRAVTKKTALTNTKPQKQGKQTKVEAATAGSKDTEKPTAESKPVKKAVKKEKKASSKEEQQMRDNMRAGIKKRRAKEKKEREAREKKEKEKAQQLAAVEKERQRLKAIADAKAAAKAPKDKDVTYSPFDPRKYDSDSVRHVVREVEAEVLAKGGAASDSQISIDEWANDDSLYHVRATLKPSGQRVYLKLFREKVDSGKVKVEQVMKLKSAKRETMDEERRCWFCHNIPEPSVMVQRCGGCKVAKYDSKACAKKHWKLHKKDCKKLKAAAARKAAAEARAAATVAKKKAERKPKKAVAPANSFDLTSFERSRYGTATPAANKVTAATASTTTATPKSKRGSFVLSEFEQSRYATRTSNSDNKRGSFVLSEFEQSRYGTGSSNSDNKRGSFDLASFEHSRYAKRGESCGHDHAHGHADKGAPLMDLVDEKEMRCSEHLHSSIDLDAELQKFVPGQAHYPGCDNDCEERFRNTDCACSTKKTDHSSHLQEMAASSVGRS